MKQINKTSTYIQVFLNEVQDDVSADEDSRAPDAGAAVDGDWPPVMQRSHVADEAHKLFRAVWHAVVRPVCELEVMNKVCLARLKRQNNLFSVLRRRSVYHLLINPNSALLRHLCLHNADDFNVEVFQVLLVLQVEPVLARVQRHILLFRPVLVTFDPSPFQLLGHHGNDVRFIFPDHLPEGGHRGRQRPLAGDVKELLCSNFHADVACVDVVLVLSKCNTRFIIF